MSVQQAVTPMSDTGVVQGGETVLEDIMLSELKLEPYI